MKVYRNKLKYSAFSFVLLLLVVACDKETFTGDSTIKPTSPSITVTGAGSYTSNEAAKEKYDFTVTLSEAQFSDVYVYVSTTSGTAVEDVNYSLSDHKVVIAKGLTSTVFSVQILSDPTASDALTFEIQIGDERTGNATMTPVMSDFTITNATDDMLVSSMSWDTNVEDAIGVEMDPEDVVDFRMLIMDATDSSIVDVVDGSGFEEYDEFNTLPDGDYLIGADIYATVDYGDLNAPVTLSMVLEFNQLGTINGHVMSFSDYRTNTNACSDRRDYFAKVTKSGADYTLAEAFGGSTVPGQSVLVGSLTGGDITIDGLGWDAFDSEVVVTESGDILIYGLGFGWINNFWGENVLAGAPVIMEVDMDNLTINIPAQAYVTTDYADEPEYVIWGTGTIDVCGKVLTITYEMEQSATGAAGTGTLLAEWTNANGYMSDELFTAELDF